MSVESPMLNRQTFRGVALALRRWVCAVLCLQAIWAVAADAPADEGKAQHETRQLIQDQACYPRQPKDRLTPQDYRKATAHWLGMVEGAHFDSHYEAYLGGNILVQGTHKHGEYVTAGFDYTLWGLPNQPRALAAVEQLSYRYKVAPRQKLWRMYLGVECYFMRAVKFYPDDPMPHAIYAYFLARRNRPAEARYELMAADREQSSEVGVNLYQAFALVELGDYKAAAGYAKRVYARGYPLPWLRERLEREGINLN